jgi:GxxExxY protein
VPPHLVEPSREVDAVAHAVIGAAIEVHRVLGPGFVESIYEEALCVELARQKLSFERQVPVAIEYKSHAIGQARLDLLVADCLIVELKAVPQLLPIHTAQLISYLRAVEQPLGLLINFHVAVLQSGIRRVIRSL